VGAECSSHGRDQKYIKKNLVGKPETKRHVGRPRRKWEYSTEMNIVEVDIENVDWIHLALDRDQWRVLYTG